MKTQDYLHGFLLIIVVFLLVFPFTSTAFFGFTNQYVLLGGFIKFFIFASYGDILSHRIKQGHYRVKGLLYKAIIWGFIGVIIVYVFRIFSEGVLALQQTGLLPFASSIFFFALFTSVFMNLIFAPTMMLFHRISDHYIEHKCFNQSHTLSSTLSTLDYKGFLSFVVFKTIPFFWIPAHTITFMLDTRYRVFFASLLGVALGLLLGLAKQSRHKEAL